MLCLRDHGPQPWAEIVIYFIEKGSIRNAKTKITASFWHGVNSDRQIKCVGRMITIKLSWLAR